MTPAKRDTSSDHKYQYDEDDYTLIGREINNNLSEKLLAPDIAIGATPAFTDWVAGKIERPVLAMKDWHRIHGIELSSLKEKYLESDNDNLTVEQISSFTAFERTFFYLEIVKNSKNDTSIHFNLGQLTVPSLFLNPKTVRSSIAKDFKAILASEKLFNKTVFYRIGKILNKDEIKKDLVRIKEILQSKNTDYPFLNFIYE